MNKKGKALLATLGIVAVALTVGYFARESIRQTFCRHDYGTYVVTKEATCNEKGEKKRVCDKCEKVDTQEIEMEEHNFKDGEFFGGTLPTCTEPGNYPGVKCANENCDEVMEAGEIPALGHEEYHKPGKPATCVEDGYTDETSCRRCGEVLSESTVIKATNKHTWVANEDIPASCTSTGKEGGFICEVCGVTDGVAIVPITEHNFVDGECSMCETQKTVLTAFKSDGEYENSLTLQENGLYSYTFASVGDYVRGDAVTIEKGETLVCDFSLSVDAYSDNGWFGVVFGDGTDSSANPHTQFGMCYYDTYCGRYMINGEKFGIDESKKIDNIFKFDGVNTNYRITLTYNQDGTYSYRLYRTRVNETHETSYFVVDKFLNFECPTPTSLMLCTTTNPSAMVANDFTLTDLTFYKLK